MYLWYELTDSKTITLKPHTLISYKFNVGNLQTVSCLYIKFSTAPVWRSSNFLACHCIYPILCNAEA